MRYRSTAVQIYDMPVSLTPDARLSQRMAKLVSVVTMVGLAGFFLFLLFGIISQSM